MPGVSDRKGYEGCDSRDRSYQSDTGGASAASVTVTVVYTGAEGGCEDG